MQADREKWGGRLVLTLAHVAGISIWWRCRSDGTRRAVALTPAMLMSGAAVGPLLGAVLVQRFGTGSIGAVALTVGIFAAICYLKTLRTPSAPIAVSRAV